MIKNGKNKKCTQEVQVLKIKNRKGKGRKNFVENFKFSVYLIYVVALSFQFF